MEISVLPRMFTVEPAKLATQDGGVQDAMSIVIGDVGGTVIRVRFALPDWERFQEAVADYEAFAALMQARAKIIGPGGLAPTLKVQKH